MMKDAAVSEVISFLLILGLIISLLAVFAAAVLPELEKADERERESRLTESFSALNTELDKLWILGTPGMQSGHLLPAGSATSLRSETVSVQSGTELSFTHTKGYETASLLLISCTLQGADSLQYEGGAIFCGEQLILSHTGGTDSTVLLCFSGKEQMLSANSPVAVQYRYQQAETYTNVSNLSLAGGQTAYWQDSLRNAQNLTLLTYAVSLEAAG